MYNFVPTERFKKELFKLLRSKKLSLETWNKITLVLSANPFDRSLKTHKVSTRNYGKRYSSRFTGDLRLIWDFDKSKELVLLLLDIGGHEGARRVYK